MTSVACRLRRACFNGYSLRTRSTICFEECAERSPMDDFKSPRRWRALDTALAMASSAAPLCLFDAAAADLAAASGPGSTDLHRLRMASEHEESEGVLWSDASSSSTEACDCFLTLGLSSRAKERRVVKGATAEGQLAGSRAHRTWPKHRMPDRAAPACSWGWVLLAFPIRHEIGASCRCLIHITSLHRVWVGVGVSPEIVGLREPGLPPSCIRRIWPSGYRWALLAV